MHLDYFKNIDFFKSEKFKNIILSYAWPFAPIFLLILLFLTPISIASLNLYEESQSAFEGITHIWAFKLPFDSNLNLPFGFLRILLCLIYFLPGAAIFSLVKFFLGKKNLLTEKNSALFNLLDFSFTVAAFSIYIFCYSVCLVENANCSLWFFHLPFYIYLLFLLAFATHACLSFRGILNLRARNPEYVEYRKVREDFSEFKRRLSIKTKFTIIITSVIAVILLTFMLLILNSYKKMFTEAVSDMGRAQAEQTAAVYDSAEGKYEKIAAFFAEQGAANNYAETPFERIDIIIAGKSEPSIYLENWESAAEFPEFDTFAYTTGRPGKIDEAEKSLTKAQAVNYLRRYKNGSYKKEYVAGSVGKTCKYIYPISFTRKAGHKIIGFAIVTYEQRVLMRQYFRTKIFVLTIISIFLYLTVILSTFLSDFIFNPLLFLRKNVRKTSQSIEKILKGTAKNTSAAVKFTDSIKTKDEIKDLSLEINEMVGLIKGMMPYVSFSTLKHADKAGSENSSKRSTSARDLCFLFTDIRGFTSLCEGLAPKKVVELLNHYLDIETQIILDNGGDVDKFVGDEMMAFFSGPRKEINACKAAMQIRAAMREQQQLSMEEGLTYVSIGIGINTGEVIFGSVGSRTRKDFTSIGDTVNLAARLESANKAYGSKSIITEAVYKKLKGMFICRELDFITVKGKTEPVRIYEILQQKSLAKKNNAEAKLNEIKELFERGLTFYREQNWLESEKCFSDCALKYNDLPSVVFLDRISHFKINPPAEDWDGVFKMSVK
ncbi:MAG: adenylate/guanylate cyclase domain-containing protein [Treponema sp.]|nr:adenylate/guanylate cyclase domain-containing protein [Treponema sp.]